jgi:FkbM family methyltransferase
MNTKINSSLDEIKKFLDCCPDRSSIETVTRWMLDTAIKYRGYNNFESFEMSGENFFLNEYICPFDPKLIIDIGANCGDFTKKLLNTTNAKIIAFEPMPKSFSSLKSIEDEFPNRVIAVNKAVGSENGSLELLYNMEFLEHASFLNEANSIPYINNYEKISVEVVTLDTFFINSNEYVDYLKIDVEGFEWDVLIGAKNIIQKQRPKFIQIEFNWHHLFSGKTMFNFSQLLSGYKLFQILGNSLLERAPRDPYTNIFHYSNFVFIRQH